MPGMTGHRTLEDKYLNGLVAAVEMIRKGCTACYDLFFEFPTPSRDGVFALGRAYRDAGLRANSAAKAEEGKQFFIDGPGGTGKSYIYKCATNHLRSLGHKVTIVASTGIAATLVGGVTAHKRFGMPIDLDIDSISNITMQSKEARDLRATSIIIWDEATASHKYAVNLLDTLLKDLMCSDLPFGGKTVVLGGDFRQCLPIITRGTNAQQVAACIKMGHHWQLFSENTFHLLINMRASNPEYAEWLLSLGNGLLPNPIELDPTKFTLLSHPDSLVKATFGNIIDSTNIDSLKRIAILSPTNKNVQELNDHVLSIVASPKNLRYSIDTCTGTDEDNYDIPPEFLYTLTPPGMPPHELNMKINGIYMLLRNMDVENGLCNGSRFILRGITPHTLHCELIQDNSTAPHTISSSHVSHLLLHQSIHFNFLAANFP